MTKLCTSCRVRPSNMIVGSWPVCGRCGGRSANDVLGISTNKQHVVGAGGIFSSTQSGTSGTTLLMYGLGAILLGIAAIFIVNDFVEER